MQPVRRQISRHAAQLRRDRTEAEDRVWQRIRNRQIGGLKWRFQHTIGRRVADFVCLEARLMVEMDGAQRAGMTMRSSHVRHKTAQKGQG